jgi:hypothetical protein
LLAVYATFSVSELKKVDPDELVPEIYDSAIVLLMGLYYFYKNSPNQNLSLTFEALGDKKVLPT